MRYRLIGSIVLASFQSVSAEVVIDSFGIDGTLTASGLTPNSTSTVELASFPDGLRTNSWGGISNVVVDGSGNINVSVPINGESGRAFYRVLGDLAEPLVTVETVTVGDVGNEGDPLPDILARTNSGAVAYSYQMGTYEVTNAEYTEFLNAVDPSGANRLLLYTNTMEKSIHGGISTNPSAAAGAKFEVKPGFDSKPVVFVSFYDAMRFCNWLHNGALAGGNTEEGAYLLGGGGPTPTNGTTVVRNPGAQFAVPTEDEWYKAAYYEPGGDVDDYWLYPTGGNSPPSASPPPGSPPAANYSEQVGTVSPVGAYTNTVGFYGTFDMAGNVEEWTERVYDGGLLDRLVRGGKWRYSFKSERPLQATNPNLSPPQIELEERGFRIVRLY